MEPCRHDLKPRIVLSCWAAWVDLKPALLTQDETLHCNVHCLVTTFVTAIQELGFSTCMKAFGEVFQDMTHYLKSIGQEFNLNGSVSNSDNALYRTSFFVFKSVCKGLACDLSWPELEDLLDLMFRPGWVYGDAGIHFFEMVPKAAPDMLLPPEGSEEEVIVTLPMISSLKSDSHWLMLNLDFDAQVEVKCPLHLRIRLDGNTSNQCTHKISLALILYWFVISDKTESNFFKSPREKRNVLENVVESIVNNDLIYKTMTMSCLLMLRFSEYVDINKDLWPLFLSKSFPLTTYVLACVQMKRVLPSHLFSHQ